MRINCQPINNLFVHEEVRFNIGQKIEQYEKQVNEGHHKLVFFFLPWRLDLVTHEQREVYDAKAF